MTFPINTQERIDLETEVINIARQLSPDELRVLKFMGRRMVDIGHGKYGPLDLTNDGRSWLDEQAQEASDLCFYQQCATIAKAQRRRERVAAFKEAADGE